VEKYWKRWVVNGEEDSKASLLAVALNVQAGGVLVVVDSVKLVGVSKMWCFGMNRGRGSCSDMVKGLYGRMKDWGS